MDPAKSSLNPSPASRPNKSHKNPSQIEDSNMIAKKMLWSKLGLVFFLIYLIAGVAIRVDENRSHYFMFPYLGSALFSMLGFIPFSLVYRGVVGSAPELDLSNDGL